MKNRHKAPFIVIERPHQKPPSVWVAYGQDDFIGKAASMLRMENYAYDPDIDGAEFDYWLDMLKDDLAGLDIMEDLGDVERYLAHPPRHNAPAQKQVLDAAVDADLATQADMDNLGDGL